MEEILVSIWCITYNHEAYIRDAIEGFLAQKTNFKYEIIIHDDASTDKTGEIIKEYEQKYPHLITAIYQKENKFSKNQPSIGWLQEIEAKVCKGKYIAVCEGDDYWIDVQKLQLQVDFLEKHSECMMTVHNAVDIDCRNFTVKARNLYRNDCMIPKNQIIMQNVLIPTASIMYRKEILEMNDFFLDAGIGDYPSLLFALSKGEIYYFSRIMSVYRYCHESSWTISILQNNKLCIFHNIMLIDFLKKYNDYTEKAYEKFIISKMQSHVDLVIMLIQKESKGNFVENCVKYDTLTNNRYHSIFHQIIELYMIINDKNYENQKVYEFAQKYNKIFIMGAGNYAKIIKEQLDRNNIYIEGFVVSNNQNAPEQYLQKSVWKWSQFPFDLNDIGIIIGINPVHWTEVIDVLKENEVANYMCPFLLISQ